MKLKHALILAALAAGGSVQAAATDHIEISVTSESGTWSWSTGSGNYCSTWTSNQTPGVIINCGVNNFDKTTSGPLIYNSGASQSSTITITGTSGYYVTAYSFKAAKNGDWSTITYNANNQGTVTITTEPQQISCSGLTEYDSASIVVNGANKPVSLTDFTVTIAKREGNDPNVLIPTTITADGNFAADTQWYTMAIGAQQLIFTSTNIDGYMPLNETAITGLDSQLWCLVGNESDGFRFYNKEAGTGMQLSAPKNPGNIGTTGGEAYVILTDPNVETTRTYEWQLSESSNLNHASYYINVKGKSSEKINNRNNRLAFWTGGADAGSSVTIKAFTPSIGKSAEGNVWTLSTSPLVTVTGPEGATATIENGVVNLSAGQWIFNTPEGQVIAKSAILKGDNSVETHITNGFDNAYHTITGPITIKNIDYNLMAKLTMPASGFPVFITTGSEPFTVGYRIPAITTVEAGPYKGRLVAMNDYRYCGGDIGAGRIDIYMSYSDDNGATWSEPGHMYGADGQPVAMGTGAAQQISDGNGIITSGLDCGYGDPAIVSDRETGEILAVACAGRMNFFTSTRENPQPSVRWWSKDGGLTWTEPDDEQYKQIYALLGDDAMGGPIKSQFIGSGRMIQSRHIKVGTHYRIYCVNSGRAVSDNTLRNWVLYSDDFGKNWKVLGGAGKPGVTSNADEPKCEELPDGSILLAARGNGGNRNFNIFRYTNIETGDGDWMDHINTNMGMGGINACNGEIMIVPAKNKETGEKIFIALQSFPYGGGRNNVSIAWKTLASPSDYDEPSDFSNWNGRYQVSYIGSAYSTMTITADKHIGFIFEEGTYAGGNTGCEIYNKISLETITNGEYEYYDEEYAAMNKQAASEMLNHRLSQVSGTSDDTKRIVGSRIMTGNVPAEVTEAINEFNNADSFNYEAIVKFNNAIESFTTSLELVEPVDGAKYLIQAINHPNTPEDYTNYLTVNTSGKVTVTSDAEDPNNIFILVKDPDFDGNVYYFYNAATGKVLPKSHANTNTEMTASAQAYNSAPYEIEYDGDGLVGLKSTQPGNTTYPYLHYAGGGRIVIWSFSGSASSHWVMEEIGMAETEPEISLYKVTVTPSEATLDEVGATKQLSFRVLPSYKDKTVTWTTDNDAVATVDAEGNVTAVGAGTAIITATAAEGYSDSCTVTVTAQSGIVEIEGDAANAETLYDLQGRRVINPTRGIYVTGNGQKVRL